MQLAQVVGQVVATVKEPGLASYKLLLVRPVGPDAEPGTDETATDRALVAIDLVGAGDGEIVLVTTGGAARIAAGTERAPTEAAVVAIADTVITRGTVTYRKS